MAERRMFSKTVIDSDAFLDMPITAQLLYFHLSMRADDDGFVNKPKSIMRMCGAKDDDIKTLFARRFVIPFESGIVVIRHWKIHNYIAKDRYHPTKHTEERAQLEIDENLLYEFCIQDDAETEQVVNKMKTEVRLGKVRLGKVRLNNTICAEPEESDTAPAAVISITLNDKTIYPIYQSDIDGWRELYPAVDIMQELRKMKGWCDSNPERRKTKRGIRRFINSWLSRQQDTGGRNVGKSNYTGNDAKDEGRDTYADEFERMLKE